MKSILTLSLFAVFAHAALGDATAPQFALIQTDSATYTVGQQASVTVSVLIEPSNPNDEIALVAKLAGSRIDLAELSDSQWATVTPALAAAGSIDLEVDVYMQDKTQADLLTGTIAFYQQEIATLQQEFSNEYDPAQQAALKAQITRDQGLIEVARDSLDQIRREVEIDHDTLTLNPASRAALGLANDSSSVFFLDADHSNRIYQEGDIATFSLSLLTSFTGPDGPQEVVARGLVDGTTVSGAQGSPQNFSFVSSPFTDYQIGANTFTGKVFIRSRERADSIRQAIASAEAQQAQDIAAENSTSDPSQQAYYAQQIAQLTTLVGQYNGELESMLTLVGTQTLDFTVTPSDRNITLARTGATQTIDIASQIASPSGTPLTITSLGIPSRGTVSMNSDGTVTYDPASDTAGPQQFRVIQADLAPGGAQPSAGVLALALSVTPTSTSVSNRPQVLFWSSASNLVPGASPLDSYAYDIESSSLAMDTLTDSGGVPNSYAVSFDESANGRFLDIWTPANNMIAYPANPDSIQQVYVKDRLSGTLTLASIGIDGNVADESTSGGLTPDGTWVTLDSTATNLTALNTQAQEQIYERNLVTGQTSMVSVDNQGNPGNGTSTDQTASGKAGAPSRRRLSDDGRYVTFYSNSTNFPPGPSVLQGGSISQTFLRDTQKKTTSLVSVALNGGAANNGSAGGEITSDGRYVIFASSSTNLVSETEMGCSGSTCTDDLYVRDLQNGTTSRVMTGDDGKQLNDLGFWYYDISEDGRYITFTSAATNVVSNATDGNYHCYLYDRTLGEPVALDVNPNGCLMKPANVTLGYPVSTALGCLYATVSADGLYAAVEEQSTNTISGNTGQYVDVFVVTRTDQFTYTATDAQGNNVTGTVTLTEPLTGSASLNNQGAVK